MLTLPPLAAFIENDGSQFAVTALGLGVVP
jgi:hypothetical protein